MGLIIVLFFTGFLSNNIFGAVNLNINNWEKKPLDEKRGKCIYSSNNGGECIKVSGQTGKNCWQCDDKDRDKLDMNWGKLSHVTEINDQTGKLEDGHYIYVFRSTDNKLLIRKYDRETNVGSECKDLYQNYRDMNNFKPDGTYMHVRHSQLNNGWDPVWAAGEMKIWNNEVVAINNESGHFKPEPASTDYVVQALKSWQIKISNNASIGNFRTVRANLTEQECAELNRRASRALDAVKNQRSTIY